VSGRPGQGRTPAAPVLALPRLGANTTSAQIAGTYNQAATQLEAADRANLKRMQEAPVPSLVMVSQPGGKTWRLWLDDSGTGGGAGGVPVMRVAPVTAG